MSTIWDNTLNSAGAGSFRGHHRSMRPQHHRGVRGEGVQRVRLRQALRRFQLLRERQLRTVW